MLKDKKFKSFWDTMISSDLSRYASTVEELESLLNDGDVEVLKEINSSLKKSHMIKATPDIKRWLTEVMSELREKKVADYLVIFWEIIFRLPMHGKSRQKDLPGYAASTALGVHAVQVVIHALFGHQFFVIALLHDIAIFHDKN